MTKRKPTHQSRDTEHQGQKSSHKNHRRSDFASHNESQSQRNRNRDRNRNGVREIDGNRARGMNHTQQDVETRETDGNQQNHDRREIEGRREIDGNRHDYDTRGGDRYHAGSTVRGIDRNTLKHKRGHDLKKRYADLYPRSTERRGDQSLGASGASKRSYGDNTSGAKKRNHQRKDRNRTLHSDSQGTTTLEGNRNDSSQSARSVNNEKPAPSRAWRERQVEEAQARRNRTTGRTGRLFRNRPGGRPNFPIRSRSSRDDENKVE